MFDTHCHLNFSRFKKNVADVIQRAININVTHITVPGTDIATSQKAIEVATGHETMYAAVGIHPHHVYEMKDMSIHNHLVEIEKLISHEKVVAVGEVGIDRHVYENTKYAAYNVDESFIEIQKKLFKELVLLAIKYKKSLIVHNREAKQDLLGMLDSIWETSLENHTVFHCCEPDEELLAFAQEHKMFIGVDGDLTYWQEKQNFIKKVPLSMLVLETDSPFLLPEPLRTQRLFPNEPKNIPIIAEKIAELKNINKEEVMRQTFENSLQLFQLKSPKN